MSFCQGVAPRPLLLCAGPPARLTFDRHFFRVSAGRCWQFVAELDRNSIWAGACMNELGERDGGRRKEFKGGRGSETTALEVTQRERKKMT